VILRAGPWSRPPRHTPRNQESFASGKSCRSCRGASSLQFHVPAKSPPALPATRNAPARASNAVAGSLDPFLALCSLSGAQPACHSWHCCALPAFLGHPDRRSAAFSSRRIFACRATEWSLRAVGTGPLFAPRLANKRLDDRLLCSGGSLATRCSRSFTLSLASPSRARDRSCPCLFCLRRNSLSN